MKNALVLFTALFLMHDFIYAQNGDGPPDGRTELEAYSLFYDAYQADDYEMALRNGEWMIESLPHEIEGYDGFSLETQLRRMVNVYSGVAEQENDPSAKSELLNKALSIFTIVEEEFGEDEIDLFDWKMREGRFYQEHRNDLDGIDASSVIDAYTEAYEMDIERFANEGDGYFARVLLTQLADSDEPDRAFEMIDEIEPYANAELMAAADDLRESLFDNPEERIEFIESRLDGAEGEEYEQMLTDLLALYEEVGNTEKSSEIALELHEINPSFESAKALADGFLDNGEYAEALQYLEEADGMAEEDEQRLEVSLDLAEAYLRTDQFEQARSNVQDAINIDSESGEAYLKMVSIYTAAISKCVDGGTLDRQDRTVYWLVLDYLEQARRADPSLGNRINNQISTYQEAMPSTEDKFFMEWEEGQSFQIDGNLKSCYSWINETTTVL